MKNSKFVLALLLLLMSFVAVVNGATPKIKVLIIDGQNNHQWQETTPRLKTILENTGIFSVEVSTTPPGIGGVPSLPKNATPEQIASHAQSVKEFNLARPARQAESATLCLLYTSPSPRDGLLSRMPSSA